MLYSELEHLLLDSKYKRFYYCVNINGVLCRYPLKVHDRNSLHNLHREYLFRQYELGVDSSDIFVFDADYIDCYLGDPIK